MTILLIIVLGAIAWFVLMLISTNILSVWVNVWIRHLVRGSGSRNTADHLLILTVSTLILAWLFLTGVFLNIMFSVAAIMLMICRLPDLAWEIENGRTITLSDIPRTKASYALTLLSWFALPVTCYGVYLLLR